MASLITITVDGRDITVKDSALLGHVLHEVKEKRVRKSTRYEQSRGLFCGMGVCFECTVTVDDCPGVRSCMLKVYSGMSVTTDS